MRFVGDTFYLDTIWELVRALVPAADIFHLYAAIRKGAVHSCTNKPARASVENGNTHASRHLSFSAWSACRLHLHEHAGLSVYEQHLPAGEGEGEGECEGEGE